MHIDIYAYIHKSHKYKYRMKSKTLSHSGPRSPPVSPFGTSFQKIPCIFKHAVYYLALPFSPKRERTVHTVLYLTAFPLKVRVGEIVLYQHTEIPCGLGEILTDGERRGKVFLTERTGWAKAQRGSLGCSHQSQSLRTGSLP